MSIRSGAVLDTLPGKHSSNIWGPKPITLLYLAVPHQRTVRPELAHVGPVNFKQHRIEVDAVRNGRAVGDVDHICQLAGNLVKATAVGRVCEFADLFFQQPLPSLDKIARWRRRPIRSSQAKDFMKLANRAGSHGGHRAKLGG